MAIIKASYTRSRAKIKATLRYIIHRPGRDGERLTRTLFGWGGEPTKEDGYQRIDADKGMTYFHLKMNFHPKREDTRKDLDLRAITRQTVATLEERFNRQIHFLAVEHNDHTQLRHIHAIVMIKLGRGERIGREDWKLCRDRATEAALLERRALDLFRGYHTDLQRDLSEAKQERVFSAQAANRFRGAAGGRARRMRTIRAPMRACQHSPHHTVVTLPNGNNWCRECDMVLAPTLGESQGLELSA
jgi:hypothetical protein